MVRTWPFRLEWVPYIVLGLSLVFTVAISYLAEKYYEQKKYQIFMANVDDTKNRIRLSRDPVAVRGTSITIGLEHDA